MSAGGRRPPVPKSSGAIYLLSPSSSSPAAAERPPNETLPPANEALWAKDALRDVCSVCEASYSTAIPRSPILSVPCRVTSTFSGLMSRWTTPC
jgi:hypothetical protein